MKKNYLIFLPGILFLLIGILMIHDYGISWDEPIHFIRGQAYLHLFLTGKVDYSDVPIIENFQGTNGDPSKFSSPRRSLYEDGTLDGQYFLKHDSGHPPLNGELAALTNYIFYQKLGILDDISSYHLFEILAASLLVFIITLFAKQVLGLFGGIISGLVLATYPLFFSESHFNIKDPPEAAFYGLTIWTFWMSVNKKSWRWLTLSALGFGFALSMKFDILFVPLIIGPFLLLRYWSTLNKNGLNLKAYLKKVPLKYLILVIFYPVTVAIIFLGSWPFLWHDTTHNFLQIVKYYKDIGTGTGYESTFKIMGGFNTFAVIWIAITTPLATLFLFVLGLVAIIFNKIKKDSTFYLWLLWLVVPILRVSLPNAAIYGGDRQIMEFLPALALIAGVGAVYLRNWLTKSLKINASTILIIALLLITNVWVLKSFHPNENVYFNSLIGGLPGARQKNIPYGGNSFGNAYYQAIEWLNKNAEPEAEIALVQGTQLNISKTSLRQDLQFSNGFWSGINRNGEYLLELTYQNPVIGYPYAWDYINKFLKPVYEVQVEGIAIAKIWKNDISHTYPNFQKPEVLYSGGIHLTQNHNEVIIKLDKPVILTRLLVDYSQLVSCDNTSQASVYISLDASHWSAEAESLPTTQVTEKQLNLEDKTELFIAGERAQYVKIVSGSNNSCFTNNPTVSVYILEP